MSNQEDVPSQDPVDRAWVLYISLLYTCGDKRCVKKKSIASFLSFWETEFAFLVSKQYITVEGAVGRETIRITRTVWMEHNSPDDESLDDMEDLDEYLLEDIPESSEPGTYAFAFIDFPNFLNRKSIKFPGKTSLSLDRIEWASLIDLIQEIMGDADTTRIFGYFHSRGFDKTLHDEASKKAALVGFEVKVYPPWYKANDPGMIVDMVDLRFSDIPIGSSVTFLVGSGDRGYIEGLERQAFHARERGIDFKIVIFSWSDAVTNVYKGIENTTLVPFDKYFSLIDPIGARNELEQ